MENNDLINFNSNENKLIQYNSPVGSNPFDNLLLKAMRHPLDTSIDETSQNNFSYENKENIDQNLLSPFITPKKNKKHSQVSTTPLYLSDKVDNKNVLRKNVEYLVDFNNSNCNHNESSLQILDESFLNDILNCALIETNRDFSKYDCEEVKESVSKVSVSEDTDESAGCLKKLRSEASSCISFHTNSFLSQNELSKISSNASFVLSNNVFDDGFVKTTNDSQYTQNFKKKTSATKAKRTNNIYNFTSKRQLNNSFGRFEFDNEDSILQHDVVFEESIKSKKEGDVGIVLAALDDGITLDSMEPPWLEEYSSILTEECASREKESEQRPSCSKIENYTPSPQINIEHLLLLPAQIKSENNSSFERECSSAKNISIKSENISGNEGILDVSQNLDKSFTIPINKDLSFEINGNDVQIINNKKEVIDNDNKSVNGLIKSIKEILNETNDKPEERKKLGESLLLAFAHALNLDDLLKHQISQVNIEDNINDEEITVEKKTTFKTTNVETIALIVAEPKLKVQPVKYPPNERLQLKTLKLKHDNEKVHKGPLKAVVPVKNMEKHKTLLKNVNVSSTPPRNSLHIKKTSTPIWPISQKPQAHSTPNIIKPTKSALQSSLQKPSSKTELNNSKSTKDSVENSREITRNSSGSVPNLSTVGQQTLLTRNTSLLRRKSSGDLKSNNKNASYEAAKETQPTKIKRSFSFQYKKIK